MLLRISRKRGKKSLSSVLKTRLWISGVHQGKKLQTIRKYKTVCHQHMEGMPLLWNVAKLSASAIWYRSNSKRECDYICSLIAHHAWSWIGNSAFIGSPPVVRTFFMRKRSIESFSDISHTVNTYCKTLEHITVEERGEIKKTMFRFIPIKYPKLISKTCLRSQLLCSTWNYDNIIQV